jgi:hypothetical protein
VKPGNYRVIAKIAEPSATALGTRSIHLGSQGNLVYKDVDLFSIAGYRNPIDFDLPAAVGQDGLLRFVIRKVTGELTYLGALEILLDSGKARVEILPTDGGTIRLLETKHFYATPWFTSKPDVRWSLSPQLGTIDSNGLYTAPSNPVTGDTPVTITARSVSDPSLSAESKLRFRKAYRLSE